MSLRPALFVLLAILMAAPLAAGQNNPSIGTSDGEHSGNFPPGLRADYDFTVTAQPAAADNSVRVSFRYVSTEQPRTEVYWGIGRASNEESNPEHLVGVLTGNSNSINVVLNDPGQTYHIRVSVDDNAVNGETYKTRLEVKASRPSSTVASSPAILYDYTFCYTTGSNCSTGTQTSSPPTTTTSPPTTTTSPPTTTTSPTSSTTSPTSSTTSPTSSTTSPTSSSESPSASPPPGSPPADPPAQTTTSSSTSSSQSPSSTQSSTSSTAASTSSSSTTSTTAPTDAIIRAAFVPDVVQNVIAIPDRDGGAMVSWEADEDADVGSYLVFRLSTPVLLATIPASDLDDDGRYRFYDPSVPEGTHHYIIQARVGGSSVTLFANDFDAASNGIRRAFVVDLGCESNETDTDGDGLCDRVESLIGTRVDLADTDGDGLTDNEELRGLRSEGRVPSDPFSADTNQDGIDDLDSIARGINPTALASSKVANEGLGWPVLLIVLLALGAVVLLAVVLLGRRKP